MEEFEKMAAIELEEPETENEEPASPEDAAEAIEADLKVELNEPSDEEAAIAAESPAKTETAEQATTTLETE
jgi:hypothetical protein